MSLPQQKHNYEAGSMPVIQPKVALRVSRDEMNLAEFPLTVLSTRANPKLKTLEFQDTIRGKNGELVERQWIITGADKFGLPTSSDDEVILGLLKLSVGEEFKNRKVFFTRYELLKALRWTTEGRSYTRLQKALDRLSGVRIKATNAFYDNASKSHSTINFGVIDAYQINDARDATENGPRTSFFEWSEVLFKSFQVGFIKKLDLDFYLALQSAVSKRLYRYLDKHFWYKARIQINLFTLAHEKVGISRNYQYLSAIRQQLDPAIEELIAAGFLSKVEYAGKGKDAEIVFYAARGAPRSTAVSQGEVLEEKVAELSPETSENGADSLRQGVFALLTARGLKEHQARKLLAEKGVVQLRRVQEIVQHFDYLCRTKSRLVNISPVGFLYRAVENPDSFVLPGDSKDKARANERQLSLGDAAVRERAEAKAQNESDALMGRYLEFRKQEIENFKCSMEPELYSKIWREVEAGLAKIKSVISPDRFKQAVEIGVEGKLQSLFAVQTFEEWKAAQKGGKRGSSPSL